MAKSYRQKERGQKCSEDGPTHEAPSVRRTVDSD